MSNFKNKFFLRYELPTIIIIGIIIGIIATYFEFNYKYSIGAVFLMGCGMGWVVRTRYVKTFPDEDDFETRRKNLLFKKDIDEEDNFKHVDIYGNVIEVGSIVEYVGTSNILRCGTGAYADAIVVSMMPFVITSRDSTMRWSTTVKIDEFKHTGTIDDETLMMCKKRLTYSKLV